MFFAVEVGLVGVCAFVLAFVDGGSLVDGLMFFFEEGGHGLEGLLLGGDSGDGAVVLGEVGDGAHPLLQDAVEVFFGVLHLTNNR